MKNLHFKKLFYTMLFAFIAQFAIGQTGYYGAYTLDSSVVSNTVGNYMLLNNAAFNGDSTKLLLETPNFSNVWDIYNNNPTAVWYDDGAAKWSVYNDNITAMPIHVLFNIAVPTTNGTAFKFISPPSLGANWTDINNASTNSNPGAIVFATHNWGTGYDNTNIYDNSMVGVWYDASNSKWSVYNEKTYDSMTANMAFNIFVADTNGGRAFIQYTHASNIIADYTVISNPWLDNNPNAVIIVTHNYTAGGGTYDTIPFGVWYDGSKWTIYNQSSAAMDTGLAFNVLVASAPVNTGIANVLTNPVNFKAYPNPASENVTLNYSLSTSSTISIKLYSVDGREVSTVFNGSQAAGNYTLNQNVSNLQPGAYFFVLNSGETSVHYPMVIAR